MYLPATFEDLRDRFVKHKHTGLDLTQPLSTDIIHGWSLPGGTPVAANYSTFLIAPFPVEVVQIQQSHTQAGTDAGAVTVTVEKLTGTQALDAGAVLLTSAFSLKATVNTVLTGSLTTTRADLQLKKGDRLALRDTGVMTDVQGVTVTVWLRKT